MSVPQSDGVSSEARITVLAGVNGSGKSSLMGELLIDRGANYFNPDACARQLRKLDSSLSLDDANSAAWKMGRDQLVKAITTKASYAFETTLGANTMPRLLKEASQNGLEVVMWYCGLESLELNIKRVAIRVAGGGHDIPESKIRERWDSCRENLVTLLPFLAELKLYDNSAEATEETGFAPSPILLLHVKRGKIISHIKTVPDWAKPIIMAAMLNAGLI